MDDDFEIAADGSAIVKLDFPVMQAGVELPLLTMRRPRIKDSVRALKRKAASDSERQILLYADLCMVGPEVLEDLDANDYRRLDAAHAAFSRLSEEEEGDAFHKQDDGSVVVPLRYKATHKKEEVSELRMRRPKVKDQLKASQMRGASEFDKEIWMFGTLTGTDVQTVESLDVLDYYKLAKAFSSFLERTDKAGSEA